jgi:hemoglobin-like flavoprotein
MVELAVKGLDRLDELLPVLQALGLRHAHYGVQEAHYNSFAAALLWTLAHELGPDFTPDVHDAWLAVYGLLAAVMKESAAAVGLNDAGRVRRALLDQHP